MNTTGLRIERGQSRGRPDDQLPCAARLDDNRRAVARIGLVKRTPQRLAGVPVKSDHAGIGTSTGEENDLLAVDERRGAGPPDVDLGAEILDAALRPDHVAALRVETEEVAHRSERPDLSVRDRRRRAWPHRVADLVTTWPLVSPERLTALRVETVEALLALHALTRERVLRIALALFQNTVGDEHATIGHGRPGVAATDLPSPYDVELLRKNVDDALLAPDAVAPRPEPLRPILRGRDGHHRQNNDQAAGKTMKTSHPENHAPRPAGRKVASAGTPRASGEPAELPVRVMLSSRHRSVNQWRAWKEIRRAFRDRTPRRRDSLRRETGTPGRDDGSRGGRSRRRCSGRSPPRHGRPPWRGRGRPGHGLQQPSRSPSGRTVHRRRCLATAVPVAPDPAAAGEHTVEPLPLVPPRSRGDPDAVARHRPRDRAEGSRSDRPPASFRSALRNCFSSPAAGSAPSKPPAIAGLPHSPCSPRCPSSAAS